LVLALKNPNRSTSSHDYINETETFTEDNTERTSPLQLKLGLNYLLKDGFMSLHLQYSSAFIGVIRLATSLLEKKSTYQSKWSWKPPRHWTELRYWYRARSPSQVDRRSSARVSTAPFLLQRIWPGVSFTLSWGGSRKNTAGFSICYLSLTSSLLEMYQVSSRNDGNPL
jgi:hypothetical protein